MLIILTYEILLPVLFHFSRIGIAMAADQAGNFLLLQQDSEAFPGLGNQLLFVWLIIWQVFIEFNIF